MMKFLIVLSLIFLSHWCQELEASTQVVVNCDCDETGSCGMKKEPGASPSSFVDIERKMLELQQSQEAIIECFENCTNGNCVKETNTFICLCETGYTGRFCNEYTCDDQPCGNNSRCTGPNQCTCDDGYQLVNDQCQDLFLNCNDVSQSGFTASGIYNITVPGINKPVQVYCELNTKGGNWLVIQRRVNGNVDFDRDWADFQAGFGELDGDFWLGLDLMHAITCARSYQLRVDIEEWYGYTFYAIYRYFEVKNSDTNYTLQIDHYTGTADDAMFISNYHPFSTRDRDNDEDESTNCAVDKRSGWWHSGSWVNCTRANLNGQYYNSEAYHDTGIYWYIPSTSYYSDQSSKRSRKGVDMKIKLN